MSMLLKLWAESPFTDADAVQNAVGFIRREIRKKSVVSIAQGSVLVNRPWALAGCRHIHLFLLRPGESALLQVTRAPSMRHMGGSPSIASLAELAATRQQSLMSSVSEPRPASHLVG